MILDCFSGWLGLISSRAWRQGAGTVARLSTKPGRATPADPSEVLPRWGKTSVPARNKPRQPIRSLWRRPIKSSVDLRDSPLYTTPDPRGWGQFLRAAGAHDAPLGIFDKINLMGDFWGELYFLFRLFQGVLYGKATGENNPEGAVKLSNRVFGNVLPPQTHQI